MTRAFCVCVPARNEADHIANLIDALAIQKGVGQVPLALCVNNSNDNTVNIARAAAERTAGKIALVVVEHLFAPAIAHAGSARRAAMDLGADLLEDDDGLLISTDADCRPPPDWIASNLSFATSDRILGGRIEMDDRDAVPAGLVTLRRRFDRYWHAVRAIEDTIDPLPWDPAPRHGDHTGASLSLARALYRLAGGVPLLETGEDRALVEAAVGKGGKLVHPMAIWTRASPRTVGRAAGGMALDMRNWLQSAERGEPPRVPSFDHWRARASWRRRNRDLASDGRLAEAERLLAAMPCDMPLPEL